MEDQAIKSNTRPSRVEVLTKEWITEAEVNHLYGKVTHKTLCAYVNDGKIESAKIFGKCVYRKQDFEAIILKTSSRKREK